MKLSDDKLKLHDRMVAAKAGVARRILADPRVSGIGVVLRESEGRLTDDLVIQICVRSLDEGVSDSLPKQIDGFPVEVVERVIKKAALQKFPEHAEVEVDKKRYDPLLGGISIGPSRTSEYAGTLGLMVRGNGANEAAVMLSNYHVMCLADGQARVGDEMCQEARSDNAVGWCGNCATLARWHVGDVTLGSGTYGVDAAVAVRTAREVSLNSIVTIGTISGTADPVLGMDVAKRGRKTEYTTGTIDSISFDATDDFGPPYDVVTLYNQITISSTSTGPFLQSGDSGSVIVDTSTDKVVGLLWGEKGTGTGVANWISAVTASMDITI